MLVREGSHMVSLTNMNDTTAPTTTSSGGTTYNITYTEDKKCEEESKLNEDEEWSKLSWYIPNKVGMPTKPICNKIRLQIRNQL